MKRYIYVLLIFISSASILIAQIDYDKYPQVTDCYFINDIHIQKSPQDSFGLGDIIIKEGLIHKVGRELEIPADAFLVDGDSAYIYAAFIDGCSYLGVPKMNSEKEKSKVKFRGHPPNEMVGITPHLSGIEVVDSDGSNFTTAQKSGFALANIIPRGKMLPGYADLILLNKHKSYEKLYREKTGLFFQLGSTRKLYPSTVIGVMAKWRDLWRKAEGHQKNIDLKQQNKRTSRDKTLESMGLAVQGKAPVIMKAPKAKDIHKALTLKEELGYNLILTELKEGWTLAEKLKANNIPVMLSTKLPKEIKAKKSKSDTISDVWALEKKALEEKKLKSYKAYLAQAASFEAAGIPFAFSFLDSNHEKSMANILRMIEAGLSKEAALAALTVNPARMFNIESSVGTIAPGKLANLVITNKPLFNKKSKVKYLFVEGELNEFQIKEKSKTKGDLSEEEMIKHLQGTWSYLVESPMGEFEGWLEISGDESLDIQVKSSQDPDNPVQAREIKINGSNLSFVYTVKMGENVDITFSANIEGDSFEGENTVGQFGTYPISGSKTSDPK